MLQPHPWLSQHHTDNSPFVLRGTLQSCSMDAIMTSLPMTAPAPAPDSMQVDAVGAASAAVPPPAASEVEAPPPASSEGAGPSSEDAPMGEDAAARPPRNPSEAPLRKLSVNLIDTYKMINQARQRLSQGASRVRAGRRGSRAGARAPGARRREGCSWVHCQIIRRSRARCAAPAPLACT